MGKNSSPPPAPDYAAAAQQTAAGNLQTAQLSQYGNMVNQYTPQGSVTYTATPQYYIGTGEGTSGRTISKEVWDAATPEEKQKWTAVNQWSQNVTLSPEQQEAYNKDVQMNAALQNVGIQGVGYVQSALNKPLESPGQAVGNVAPTQFTSNVAPTQFTSNVAPTQFVSNVKAPTLQTQVADSGNIQMQAERPTIDVTGRIANAGQIQRNVANNANQIVTRAQDPTLVQQDVTNALYNQQTQYLDPQFNQSQAKLENQLANQGITRGSEAWNNAMGDFSRQKQQAYESARQSAIGQGTQAASTLYQNQLAGLGFGNQALGQQFGQNVTQAQLVNAAQGQQFGQNLSAAQLQNAANAQQAQNALAYGQFANQAQQQKYQQNLSNMQAQNAAMQAQFGIGMSNAELANQAAQQTFGQGITNANLANQAAQQIFGQGLTNANLANQAAQQTFGQGLTNAQLANQALQQNFGNAQTLRQEPINMLNAVRSGSQMQTAAQPQVGVSQPGQLATVSGPDYLSAATATGQYNQGLYNAQQAAQSNMLGGLMGLAGTGMMAYGMKR